MKTHEERMHELLYDCEGIVEKSERICKLEEENAKLRELLAGDETQRRIAAIGEGTVPTYHGTETVDEARIVVENAKLRELCSKLAQVVANDDVTFRELREIAKRELGYDFIGAYDSSLGDMDQLPLFSDHMRELGIEVES